MSKKRHLITRQLNELIGDTIIMREALVAICRDSPTAQVSDDIRETLHSVDTALGHLVDYTDYSRHYDELYDAQTLQASEHYDRQHDEIVTLLTTIGDTLAAIAQHAGIEGPIDPTPGDYGTDQCPRTVNGPQNAIQRAAMDEVGEDPDDYEPYDVFQPALNRARHATTVPEVEFPTGPDWSLWWVQGTDSDQPVEGIGILSNGRFYALDGEWTIDSAYPDDHLYEATRVVAVPLRLLEALYDASALNPEAVLDRIHAIEQWTVDHGQTGE